MALRDSGPSESRRGSDKARPSVRRLLEVREQAFSFGDLLTADLLPFADLFAQHSENGLACVEVGQDLGDLHQREVWSPEAHDPADTVLRGDIIEPHVELAALRESKPYSS